MAKGVKPRIKVPKQASAGEAIIIKTLISHKMETGLRKDADGKKNPQSIINKFTCDFNIIVNRSIGWNLDDIWYRSHNDLLWFENY